MFVTIVFFILDLHLHTSRNPWIYLRKHFYLPHNTFVLVIDTQYLYKLPTLCNKTPGNLFLSFFLVIFSCTSHFLIIFCYLYYNFYCYYYCYCASLSLSFSPLYISLSLSFSLCNVSMSIFVLGSVILLPLFLSLPPSLS